MLPDPLLDPRALRAALASFSTGCAIVTSTTGEGRHLAVRVTSFSSVSLDPPLVLWSLHRESPSLEGFQHAGRFTINLLALDQRHLSHRFNAAESDELTDVQHDPGPLGCPRLRASLAVTDCSTYSTTELGDHVLFVGEVHAALCREAPPLTFFGGALGTFRMGDPQT